MMGLPFCFPLSKEELIFLYRIREVTINEVSV